MRASKETLHKEVHKYHYKLTYTTNNLLFLSMFLDYLFPLLESDLLTHPESIQYTLITIVFFTRLFWIYSGTSMA